MEGGGGGGEERREEEERRPSVREMQISIAASSVFPGFRFSPTDEELILYYLKKKMEGCDKCVEIIPEVDFCRHEPWDLPGSSVIQSDNEWFFFSARGRKYPNGSQSRRATESGYWKATGKERNVKSGSNVIGTKRTLVFHTGRAPKGERTEWIMHEYCMDGTSQDSMVVCRLRRNNDFHLNENPRRRSQDRRHLPDGHNNGGFPLSDGIPQNSARDTGNHNASKLSDGVQQVGILDGVRDDSNSKEYASSHNSHSVEQNDSGSESNRRHAEGYLRHGSSSFEKFSDGEDDWFADIMKDDIVKLDESSLCTSQTHVPLVVRETEVQVKPPQQSLPSQGTANRRIRLRKQRIKIRHVKSIEIEDGSKTSLLVNEIRSSLPQQHGVFTRRTYVVVLVFLGLFLSWLGGSWQGKRCPLVSNNDG